MTLVGTSTTATPLGTGSGRVLDRNQDGTLWVALTEGTGISTDFYYSKDNGATWTDSNGALENVGVEHALFIDVDDYAHLVYKAVNSTNGHANGHVYYRRGTPNAGRTAWTWSGVTRILDQQDVSLPDVVAHREGTGWAVHVVLSYLAQSLHNVTYYKQVTVSSTGTITVVGGDTGLTALSDNYQSSTHTYPSIDFNHTGDAKTVAGGAPHLYVAWSTGTTAVGTGVRFRKATYSGGAWTWNAERQLDATRSGADASGRWITCLFDGTRVVVAGYSLDSSLLADLVLYERDAADTTTTTRVLADNINSADGYLSHGSAAYDTAGNVYLFGRDDTGSNGAHKINYRKWTRSGATLGPIVTFDTTGNDTPNVHARRGASHSSLDFVWVDGTASPYSVQHDRASLNQAPNAPTLTSPTGGVTIDRTAAQRFSWAFSDPDAGDTQSAYSLQYRIAGSGSAWTVVSASTPSQFRDFAGSTFAAGNYEWQVRTTDAAGLVGPYSASGLFTAATPPAGPTITAPTNGSTLSATPATVTWSASSQEAYQVRRVADNAGSPDTATIYYDSGEVTSTTARSLSVAFPTNDRYEHVQLRVRSSGLWSAYTSVRVLVSYTPPEAPTVDVATADSATASIAVRYGHRHNILSANVASVETDATGFAAGGNATLARSTGEVTAVDGTAVLKLTLPAAGNSNFRVPTTRPVAAPGQVWTARFAVRSNVSRSIQCNIRFINAAGTSTLATATSTLMASTTTGWTVVTATGIAPADTGLIDMLPQVLSGATTDVHYFDAFALRFANKNLLGNPNFEEGGLAGWQPGGTTLPTIALSTARAYEGTSSLLVTWATASALNASVSETAAPTRLVAGRTYTASGYVYVPAGSAPVSIRVSSVVTGSGTTAFDTWQRVSVTWTATSANNIVVFIATNGATAGQTAYIDAVQIEEGPVATAFQPPAPWTPGGTPAASYVDVHRRDTVTGEELRIATGQPSLGTYTDRTPASGRPYEYRVTAVAANNTTAVSPWTA